MMELKAHQSDDFYFINKLVDDIDTFTFVLKQKLFKKIDMVDLQGSFGCRFKFNSLECFGH